MITTDQYPKPTILQSECSIQGMTVELRSLLFMDMLHYFICVRTGVW